MYNHPHNTKQRGSTEFSYFTFTKPCSGAGATTGPPTPPTHTPTVHQRVVSLPSVRCVQALQVPPETHRVSERYRSLVTPTPPGKQELFNLSLGSHLDAGCRGACVSLKQGKKE